MRGESSSASVGSISQVWQRFGSSAGVSDGVDAVCVERNLETRANPKSTAVRALSVSDNYLSSPNQSPLLYLCGNSPRPILFSLHQRKTDFNNHKCNLSRLKI